MIIIVYENMCKSNNKFRFKKSLSAVLVTDEIPALLLRLLQVVNRNSLPFCYPGEVFSQSILTVLLIPLLSLHGIELFDAHKGTKSLLI